MAQHHEYPVSVQWNGGRDGKGVVVSNRSGVQAPLAVPPEFQGDGQGTNPEELLASAVAACYTITLGIIAANRKLPVKSLNTEGTGVVEQSGAQFTYQSVTLKPKIVLAAEATDEQAKMAEEMAHKADGYCIITNALRGKVEIIIEPTIVRE